MARRPLSGFVRKGDPIVKKNRLKKLNLNRETLRSLDTVKGGLIYAGDIAAPQKPRPITDSETISICKYCTTPLDTCPDPTIA
jgi:hypothetical protein